MENSHIIIGYLGKAPELSYTPNNKTAKAVFSVATTEAWKDKSSGEKKEKTTWHNVEVWSNIAEACANNLSKGSLVYVRGPHLSEQWEKDGNKKTRSFIRAKKVKFLPSK